MSLRRDSIANLAGNVVPLFIAIWAIPHLINGLGYADFGILSLMWALVGYFGLFDLGVGRALTYDVSRNLARGETNLIATSVSAGLTLTLLTGLIGAAIVALATWGVQRGWWSVPGQISGDQAISFMVIAAAVIPTTLTSGLRGLAEGYGRFGQTSFNRMVFGVLMFLMPALALQFHGKSLTALATYLALSRVLVFVHMAWCVRREIPLRPRFEWRHVRALFAFGAWVTISGLISPLMVYGDRFILSAVIGVKTLPLYAVPQEALQRLLILPAALTSALFPRLTAKRWGPEVKGIYNHYLGKIGISMLAVCVLSALLTRPVLSLWISPQFAADTVLVVPILCAGLWFNAMAQLPMTVLHAMGRPDVPAKFHLAEFFLYGATVYLLTRQFGIVGAAAAWSLRVVLDALLLHTAVWHFCRAEAA